MAHVMHEAHGETKKEGKAKLHHIRIHPHKGGHLVTHHNESEYGHEEKPSASHVFAKEDGHALLAHIAKHAKIEAPTEADENEPHGGEATEEAQEGED